MHSSERLKGIDVFVTAVDAGSFTAAAERLNLTNSAVGKSIARLEARLGVRLFERTTRRMDLTDAGQAFYRTCQGVLSELEEAEHVLKAEHSMPVGKLRIDLPATYGRMHVMPVLFEFLKAFPGVQPQISFTDRFTDLVEEGIDVAVRLGGADAWPASIGHRYLGRERRIFCCAPAYLQRVGSIPDDLNALDRVDAVLYRRPNGTPSPWLIQRGDAPVEHLHPVARLEVGSAESWVQAIGEGFGVGQVATWLVQEQLETGALVQLLPSFAVDGVPLYLLWQRSRQLLPKVDALLAHLATRLQVSIVEERDVVGGR
ncbi:LysR family transcriptional regulator [Roseateles terrae]|uniref:DNA-binding transcriptional LysR family regulator n=1 Tax=Roseateles terrae TaxID=431060 RepID=A0ABR6GT66_9BURK|nr:LysR family transcriptional regulator [Roseateles terrae]MBB3194353.1 DNA-binding transcriptional LysR family regulator [Roseateles terrae]OWQ88188.1 LysR family transcriptional regulator [Roseateles terrae]